MRNLTKRPCRPVQRFTELGRKSVALQADLLSDAGSQPLVARAAEALGGPLTVLVNNASIFEHDTLDTATRSSWDRHIESNLRAPFVLMQEFAKQVPQAQEDAAGEPMAAALIINMLDQRVRKLTPDFASYTVAKMGLWALTQNRRKRAGATCACQCNWARSYDARSAAVGRPLYAATRRPPCWGAAPIRVISPRL